LGGDWYILRDIRGSTQDGRFVGADLQSAAYMGCTHITHLVTICFQVFFLSGVDVAFFKVSSEGDMPTDCGRLGKALKLV
jgi:hypothetical protein